MSSVFKIYSPEDCDFYYDGELQGHIEGNSKKAFRFEVERKGVYRLEFINSEYQTELMMKVSIDADEEREVELDFSEVNEPVIQRLIIAIEHDYGWREQRPKELLSIISKNVITIPKGVKKIGNRAFHFCTSLTSITIPNNVTVICSGTFSGCSDLTSITIPNSVTKIMDFAFSDCLSLTSITIPNGVTDIGEGAFSDCRSLSSVYCKATIPPNISIFDSCYNYNAFDNNAEDLKIYVPKSEGSTVLEAYKSADGWKDYADSIEEYDFDNE